MNLRDPNGQRTDEDEASQQADAPSALPRDFDIAKAYDAWRGNPDKGAAVNGPIEPPLHSKASQPWTSQTRRKS